MSTAPISEGSLRYWNSEVAKRQETLRHDFGATVRDLRSQGIEVPEIDQHQGIEVPL